MSDYYGSTVTVTCTARGNPQPHVNWYKNGIAVTSMGNIDVTNTIIDNTTVASVLTISSVSNADEGMYMCSGNNTLPNGTVINSQSFILSVVGGKLDI